MAFLLRLLRLRYLIFGTAVGGGYAAHKVGGNGFLLGFTSLTCTDLLEIQGFSGRTARSIMDERVHAGRERQRSE